MKNQAHRFAAWMVAALCLFTVPAQATHPGTGDPGAEVIVEWNQLLQANIPATASLLTPRYFAMLHIAMFDAVNAIERQYTPYHARLATYPGASAEAAAGGQGYLRRRTAGPARAHPAVAGGRGGGRRTPGRERHHRLARHRRELRAEPGLRVAHASRPVAADFVAARAVRELPRVRAIRLDHPNPIPARSAADLDQRALHRGLGRSPVVRVRHQQRAYRRGDTDRAAVRQCRQQHHPFHDVEPGRARRGAGSPRVAGRHRATVRADECLDARRVA